MSASHANTTVIRAITPTLYARLRWMARGMLTGLQHPSLSPTDLVGCALVRIEKSAATVPMTPQGAARGQIFALCRRAMRSCIVERVRRRTSRLARELAHADNTVRATRDRVSFAEWLGLVERLRRIDVRKASVFEMRAIRGMSVESIAGLLCVSERTVEVDYRMARAWLQGEVLRMGWLAAMGR